MTSLSDFIPRRNKGPSMSEHQPKLPPLPRQATVEVPQNFAPPPRRVTSRAAQEAAVQWEELENDLSYTKDLLQSREAALKVNEATILALREELRLVKERNEILLRENTRVAARLDSAVDVLLGIRSPAPAILRNRDHEN